MPTKGENWMLLDSSCSDSPMLATPGTGSPPNTHLFGALAQLLLMRTEQRRPAARTLIYRCHWTMTYR